MTASPPAATLGFGCARLQLAVDRAENQRILGTAWDAGVRWFDVARSYGYGATEGILGTFLAGRRDQATVVTKFGISPPPALVQSPLVRAVARRLVHAVPKMKRQAVVAADALTGGQDFSVVAARHSLHTSLRKLRTDHVDALLLHEAHLGVAKSEELFAWLDSCVDAGTVRRWGIATSDLETTGAICRSLPIPPTVVQVPDSILRPARDFLPQLDRVGFVGHSLLRIDLPIIAAWLAAEPSRRASWSERVNANLADRGVLATLVLATALHRSGSGTVLFSSRDAARCGQAAGAPEIPAEVVSAFEHLVRLVRLDQLGGPPAARPHEG